MKKPPSEDKAAPTTGSNASCPQMISTTDSIKCAFESHLRFTLAKDQYSSNDHDRYVALAMTVRDRLVDRWIRTSQTYHDRNVKRVYYLSMEYLIGRSMGNNVINLGMEPAVMGALEELELDWGTVRDIEHDAGLGNGGLGRLAACFLDSMATLELPGYGYGIRYEYGIFRQTIRNGFQVEEPDNWLRSGNPWEIERPDYDIRVGFGGRVVEIQDARGRAHTQWIPSETVVGLPYDVPIAGYRNNTVNNLRLWTAKGTEEFDLSFFNNGDYIRAYEVKTRSENITKVLYPNDKIEKGRALRFKQQYFFVCCSLQDIIRRFRTGCTDFGVFPDKVAIQLNDTHPALAVAELMRLLVDIEGLEWDRAWELTQATLGYTNHTLMPEALECWTVRLFEEVLPRHLTIIYEINRRFLRAVMNRYPDDHARLQRMSLIEEGPEKLVRMANLAVVGSHRTNGVAKLHSKLLQETLFRDVHDMWPERFANMTNGITQRRWLLKCNPALADAVTRRIGDGWVKDLFQIKRLESYADDPELQVELRRAKHANKLRLAGLIRAENGVVVNLDSIFDVQAKRLHEYKRQMLNLMHIVYRYNQLKDNPALEMQPRTFIFAAKAAPGYAIAKLIIKLINDVAGVINNDPVCGDRLRVVFLSDYCVSLAERITPASDLSEQISTAGTEASGTGNMKFALNGALTIGTLDGANIEIRDAVGAENFFAFGLTIDEVKALRAADAYNPYDLYNGHPEIKRILDYVGSDFFNMEQPGLFRPLYDALLTHGDYYLHLADFASYIACQERVDAAYRDPAKWARMCVMNIANMGYFSSDRTILEYAKQVWNAERCPIAMSDVPAHSAPGQE